MLYDYDNRSGFLFNKFKNNPANPRLPRAVEVLELTEEQKEDYRQFFKNCVVAKEKELIKQKLRESVDYRKSMMADYSDDFNSIFDFYFVSPDLIKF